MSNNKEVFHQSFELMQSIKDQIISDTFDLSQNGFDHLFKKYRHNVSNMRNMSNNVKSQFINKLNANGNSNIMSTSNHQEHPYPLLKQVNKPKKYYHVIEDDDEEEIYYSQTRLDSMLAQEKNKEPETEASADTNSNEDSFIGHLLKLIINNEEQIIQKENISKGLVNINYYLNAENPKEKKSLESDENLAIKKKVCLALYKIIKPTFPDFSEECIRKGVLFLEYVARINDPKYGEKYKATIEQIYFKTRKLVISLSLNPVKFTNIIYIVFQLIFPIMFTSLINSINCYFQFTLFD